MLIIIIDSAVKNVIKIGGISGICYHLDGVGWDWFITCWLICCSVLLKSLVLVAQLGRRGFGLFCLGSLVICGRLCDSYAVLSEV